VPSPWIVQWAGLVAAGAAVLDVAAGRGRHALFFAERGHKVTAVDRDPSMLPPHANLEIVAADLAGDYPAIEYAPPHGRYSMDILSRLGEALNDRRKLDRFGPGADDHGHWNFFHRRASQNKERSQINEGQGRPKVFPQRAVAKGRSSRGPLRPESAGFFRH